MKHFQRRVDTHHIQSKHMNEWRKLKVFVPSDYTESRAYPVLYLQDGEEYFNFGRVATISQDLITQKQMIPILIVGICVDLKHRTEEYSLSGTRSAAYQCFLLHEIIPFMDRHYTTIPAARGRVIGGSSLGATQALLTACQEPERFSSILSQSGAFYPNVLEDICHRGDFSWLESMYQVVGDQEDRAETPGGILDILQWNRQMADCLRKKKVNVHYEEKPGQHTWGFWQRDLPDALRFLFGDGGQVQ